MRELNRFPGKIKSLSFLLVFLNACGQGMQTSEIQSPISGKTVTSGIEKQGYLTSGGETARISYEEQGGFALVGGDMLIPLEKIHTSDSPPLGLSVENSAVKKWPNGRVPYVIPSNFAFQAEVKHMVSEWSKTGIKWVPKNEKDANYVSFEVNLTANYCGQSAAGLQGGKQVINMPSAEFAKRVGCKMKHVMLHETGHALGFMHEHQRPDRDSFVKFKTPLAQSDTWLKKFSGATLSIGAFDINSVMMYGTENTVPQMIALNGSIIPLRDVLSEKDIEGARAYYFNTATCNVTGGAGKSLFRDSVNRETCIAECKKRSVTHPGRSCKWATLDIKNQ